MREQPAKANPLKHSIDELKTLRDDIRLNIHLARMDLRDEWHEIEKKLPDPDRAATQLKELTADVVDRLAGELRRFRARLQKDGPSRSVARFMSNVVATCRPSDSLAAAVTTMWNRDLGFLVVVDDAGKPVGVITDRDAAMAACTRGLRMDDLTVEAVMTRQVWPCRAEDSVEGALKVMAGKLVRRLPVVAEDGKLVGILTLGDVARAVLETADGQREAGLVETVSALARITAPARPSQPA